MPYHGTIVPLDIGSKIKDPVNCKAELLVQQKFAAGHVH
jgi:hypothetical protein